MKIDELSVKIRTKDVIEALTANKLKHIEEYEEAVEGYFETLAQQAKYLNNIVKKADLKSTIRITPLSPVLRVDEYDDLIQMFSAHTEEFIELDKSQYAEFVLDKTRWREDAFATNMGYVGVAKALKSR